jgi:iron complex outermembrane receptor protein
MKPHLIFLSLLFFSFSGFAQNSIRFIVKDSTTRQPLPDVTVSGAGLTMKTDSSGSIRVDNLPNGQVVFSFSFVGHAGKSVTVSFPSANGSTVQVLLAAEEEDLDEVIVESTRLNRSIKRLPTRIETLTEEIDEAASMEPSRIAHLITHSTGIQVQTTAATSNGAVIRIQGLQGRYTKILKDGFPLYGGFSGSLDVLQIPPLDLRQVEYIKGSASTLYGGGAIAGIVNLLSKRGDKEEVLLHLNRSSIGSNDFNAFVAKPFGKWSLTSLASLQLHNEYDADEDGYSDMPDVAKFNFNPKIFFHPDDKTAFYLGAVVSKELRKGGDMRRVKNVEVSPTNYYLERHESDRVTTQFSFDRKFNKGAALSLKNSFSLFNRFLDITENAAFNKAIFGGEQVSTFTELTYNNTFNRHSLVAGLNYISDDFKEDDLRTMPFPKRDEKHTTVSAFVNHIWDATSFLSIESGLRTEWNKNRSIYTADEGKLFILPRVSALVKYSPKFTTRVGGGLGYKPVTIFNEEAESYGFKGIYPVNYANVVPEQSYGLNADLGYQSRLGTNALLSLNHMFFYNWIENPVVFTPNTTGGFFTNGNANVNSKGFETQVKLTVGKFTWFLGYTYTDAYYDQSPKQQLVLVPKHSIKGDILFVEDGKWRIGWDYEYKSSQRLSNGAATPDLFSTGVVIERTLGSFVLFFNAENITDVRQTKYESLRSAPYSTPQFTEIWAPLDGRFLNFGLKVRL